MRFDLRTLPVRAQAEALNSHLRMSEEIIADLSEREQRRLNDLIEKHQLTPDDPDWQIGVQDLQYQSEYRLPQFFRGLHLLMVWAAYETSVTEIADHARELLPQDPSPLAITDLSGDFLSKAKKYYGRVLGMELWSSQQAWEHIAMLKHLRNVLIHASGRTDRISDGRRKQLEGWEHRGITMHYDDLTVSAELTRSISDHVVNELRALVDRFYEYEARVRPETDQADDFF